MKAGTLRERVTFEKRNEPVDDGYGNVLEAWGDSFTVAARIMPLKSGEEVIASRLAGRQPVLITVRRSIATLGLTTECRATDARTGTVYNIRTVTPTEDKVAIDLLCEAGVPT